MQMLKRIQQLDLNVGGRVDIKTSGLQILAILIEMEGLSTTGTPLDLDTDSGQYILESTNWNSIVSESHLGFLERRTIRENRGGAGRLQPAVATNPFRIVLKEIFGVRADHKNVYVGSVNDVMELTLPAISAGDATGFYRVSLVHTVGAIPRYALRKQNQNLTVAEGRFNFNGHITNMELLDATVTNPTNISVFDSQDMRYLMCDWDTAKSLHTIEHPLGRDTAGAESVYVKTVEGPFSQMISVLASEVLTIEFTDGAGFMDVDVIKVRGIPQEAVDSAQMRNAEKARKDISAISINPSKSQLAPTLRKLVPAMAVEPQGVPISPVTRRRVSPSGFTSKVAKAVITGG